MRNTKPSFGKFLFDIIENNFVGFNFYPEADIDIIAYPAIVLHWGAITKTQTTGIWSQEVQIDILVSGFNREICDRVTYTLLEILSVSSDDPKHKTTEIPKYRFFDKQGKKINPQFLSDSVIKYYWVSEVNSIYEPDKPELMHNTFSLELRFRNDG